MTPDVCALMWTSEAGTLCLCGAPPDHPGSHYDDRTDEYKPRPLIEVLHMSPKPDTIKATFYGQFTKSSRGRATLQRTTTSRPDKPVPGAVVAKVSIALPAAAFEPLEAEGDIPANFVQRVPLIPETIVQGYVWCDRHGCIHDDGLDPYDYGADDPDLCDPRDHSPVHSAGYVQEDA